MSRTTTVDLSALNEFSEILFNEKKNLLSMAAIKAPAFEANEVDKRAPIDVICVLDRSGSMAGAKLNLTKDAMAFVIDQLDQRDSLAIVTYDTHVRTDLALTVMSAENKKVAKDLVKRIQAGSSTNLSGGLLSGLEVVAQRTKPNDVCSVLLFTDGLANHGVVDIPGITELCEKSLKACKVGSSVFTFGFGADHDPAMLKNIATVGKGMYYFIESVDQIPLSFADCIGGLQSVVAQNLKLQVKSQNGAVISALLSKGFKFTGNIPGDTVEMTLGDLYSEEERDIIFSIELPSLPAPTPSMEYCQFTLSYFNVLETISATTQFTATVARPGALSGELVRNVEVDKQYNRIVAADALNESRKLADAGNLESAKQVLMGVKAQMMKSVSNNDAYTSELNADMDDVLESMASTQIYQSSGKQMMYSKQMNHEQQRSSSAKPSSAMYQNSAKSKAKKAYAGEH